MKKIGIVTLTRNPNYGNVLQNIALQTVIRSLGYEPETIPNTDRTSLFFGKSGIKELIKIVVNKDDCRTIEIRRRRFLACCKKNIKYSKAFYDGSQIRGDISYFKSFIVGSDQVWNPFFDFASDFEMLRFADKEKRISYAASFGVSDISKLGSNGVEQIAKGLSEFKSLSVRENTGKSIANSFGINNCEVHLDPTMLIGRGQWDKYVKKPKLKLPNNYVVLYMLGNMTDEYWRIIEELKKKHHASVINVLDSRYRVLDPLEFIWLIKNAKCVCTDSFHATVFSIIYHKWFVILNRIDAHENQNDRFVTLLSKLGIDYDIGESALNNIISWESVDENIAKERIKSIQYLTSALA